MFKALGRIGKDKTVFDVEIKPVNARIYTNQAFNFKLQVQRGKQRPEETKQYKVDRSVKNTDIKQIDFAETFTFPCTYFVKEGVPEAKTCTFQLSKLFPGGNEVVIARKEVNLSMHFGQQFQEQTIDMEVTKQAQGSIIKSFTFRAVITCNDEKDRELYDQCIQWRQIQDEADLQTQALTQQSTQMRTASEVVSVGAASRSFLNSSTQGS